MMSREEAARVICRTYRGRIEQDSKTGEYYLAFPCAFDAAGEDLEEAMNVLDLGHLAVEHGSKASWQ